MRRRIPPPPPPPPPKRRTIPPPPPAPPVRRALPVPVAPVAMADGPIKLPGIVNRHVLRVTLNLIRNASVCPKTLRKVLDRLADHDWDWATLTRTDAETIYAYVDDQIGERALSEYMADPTSIVDNRGNTTDCKLCGHKHVRWEFLLVNTCRSEGGRDLWTGSTCVVEYGINVDGSGSAEEAKALLDAAVAQAIRSCTKEDWQKDHPDHEASMRAFGEVAKRVGSYIRAYRLHRWLPGGSYTFGRKIQKSLSTVRAITKYYRKNGYLTEHKTAQWLGSDGTSGMLGKMAGYALAITEAEAAYELTKGKAKAQAEVNRQLSQRPPRKGGATEAKADAKAKWQKLIDDHGAKMTTREYGIVDRWVQISLNPRWIKDHEQTMIDEIKARKASPGAPPAPPVHPFGATAPRATNTDLPF